MECNKCGIGEVHQNSDGRFRCNFSSQSLMYLADNIKDCEEKLKEVIKDRKDIKKALKYKRLSAYAKGVLCDEESDLDEKIEEMKKHIKELKEDYESD